MSVNSTVLLYVVSALHTSYRFVCSLLVHRYSMRTDKIDNKAESDDLDPE